MREDGHAWAPESLRRGWTILILAAACRGESERATLPPASPRPAPTITATLGSEPVVTTAGSPVPVEQVAPGTAVITIHDDRLEMPSQLPPGHHAFHVFNRTAAQHELRMSGATGQATVTVAPQAGAILQMVLRDSAYELRCMTPGHAESARLRVASSRQ